MMSDTSAKQDPRLDWYVKARYGLFIHYGLYSQLARGEWVMNREQIPPSQYAKLADNFKCEHFDSEKICDLAVRCGMKYIVLTTMHHDGFRLYDTALTPFSTAGTAAKRDLVAEIVASARKRGLRIGLYHSLNNWMDQPDSVAALEDKAAYEVFIKATFDRIRELVTKYNPIDILWYDGWWPFNADQWQSIEMNRMVKEIQPHILFNGRNGLPGDFGTPENHVSAPKPWRPWEACITMNNSWGYHAGDYHWKSPRDVVEMLIRCASQNGNLLLNIGPKGDGSIPAESLALLETVGKWLEKCRESIFDTDIFTYDLQEKGDHRSEYHQSGVFTATGNNLYFFAHNWISSELIISGTEFKVKKVTILNTGEAYPFEQQDGKLIIKGLPQQAPDPVCPVFKIEGESKPRMYLTGGMRTPKVSHPHYDPCASDIVL
ncbi:MAG: alpha-L-fucosidase [Verrucomicrobiota bacterium]|nr:alpha-L-fucosidase [Verrucomicrobiota bacterium]